MSIETTVAAFVPKKDGDYFLPKIRGLGFCENENYSLLFGIRDGVLFLRLEKAEGIIPRPVFIKDVFVYDTDIREDMRARIEQCLVSSIEDLENEVSDFVLDGLDTIDAYSIFTSEFIENTRLPNVPIRL